MVAQAATIVTHNYTLLLNHFLCRYLAKAFICGQSSAQLLSLGPLGHVPPYAAVSNTGLALRKYEIRSAYSLYEVEQILSYCSLCVGERGVATSYTKL